MSINPKITVRCTSCGLTLKDYPAKGPTLPIRCPKCGVSNCWKEERPRLYIPVSAIPAYRKTRGI